MTRFFDLVFVTDSERMTSLDQQVHGCRTGAILTSSPEWSLSQCFYDQAIGESGDEVSSTQPQHLQLALNFWEHLHDWGQN